jgi:uncharacterized protein (TIGR02246 family)
MTSPTPAEPSSTVDLAVRTLYRRLLDRWNQHDADGFAACFAADGSIVGFDGSQVNGREAVRSHLRQIFADHVTSADVALVRQVRLLAPGVALLRGVAGMAPPGQRQLNPAVNAVQTLVAVEREGHWQIALFQNTPAQFHGRPEETRRLTDELQRLL